MKTMHDLILAAQAGWEYRMEHGAAACRCRNHSLSVFICDTLHHQTYVGLDEQFGHLLFEVREACTWIAERIGQCFSVEQYIKRQFRENEDGTTDFYLFVDSDHPAVINERRKIFAELLVKYPAEEVPNGL